MLMSMEAVRRVDRELMESDANAERERMLVSALAAGSTDAFDELYDTYFPYVYGYFANELQDRQDVEDLTSEVFLRLWRRADTFRGDARLSTWLFAVARNVLIDFLRKRKRHGVVASLNATAPDGDTELVDRLSGDSESPDAAIVRLEEHVEVWNAMDKLESLQRTVLEMRFVKEMSYDQIAVTLDVPVGTVKSRLSRAVGTLRRMLQRPLAAN